MNFGKSALKAHRSGGGAAEGGNAMIYVLLALALIGILTASLVSQDSTGGDDLSKDQVTFQMNEILTYASDAQASVDRMIMGGVDAGSIDFVRPNASSFNTAPNGSKLFHPAGGGLNYKSGEPEIFTGMSTPPPAGWYIVRFNNLEWTPTATQDIMAVAYQISQPVCAAINKKLTGSATIPAYTGNLSQGFVGTLYGAGSNVNVTNATCPGCTGKPALCISNTGVTAWAFYSILEAR